MDLDAVAYGSRRKNTSSKFMYEVKAYQFQDHHEWIRAQEDRLVRTRIAQRVKSGFTGIFVHSIKTDFWAVYENVNAMESGHSKSMLAIFTTPYLEECVRVDVLIPLSSTEGEWEMQSALGLEPSWGRTYKLNPDKLKDL